MPLDLKALTVVLAIALATQGTIAADLGATPSATEHSTADATALHSALSRYLTLEMIRATFDVVPRDDLETGLVQQLNLWADRAPSPGALADLDRQLLAEASYYLVSLQYVIEVGGAAFPPDRTGSNYSNDSLVKVMALQRELPDLVAAGADITPLLVEAERIRALTEGYTEAPEDFGVFAEHEKILAAVWEARMKGTRT
jgi:hypothetical protein